MKTSRGGSHAVGLRRLKLCVEVVPAAVDRLFVRTCFFGSETVRQVFLDFVARRGIASVFTCEQYLDLETTCSSFMIG